MNPQAIPMCDICGAIKAVHDEMDQCKIMVREDLDSSSSLNYIFLAEGMADAVAKFEAVVGKFGGCPGSCHVQRKAIPVDIAI